MQMYTLKHPFVGRHKGADVDWHELPLPAVVTVGMLRQVPAGNSLLRAHALTEVCAGLGPFEAAKVNTADAVGYTNALADLLEPFDEPGFALPVIRPVRALMAKITVEPSNPVEFVAQVLQHSGMTAAVIDALDVRAYLPALAPVMEQVTNPKT